MNSSFQIVTNPQTIEVGRGQSSRYGELYICCDDFVFPCKHWGDLIDSVFDMWMNSMKRLRCRKKASFYFMDGPYYFTLEKTTKGMLKATFFSSDELVYSSGMITLDDFKDSVIRAVNSIRQE